MYFLGNLYIYFAYFLLMQRMNKSMSIKKIRPQRTFKQKLRFLRTYLSTLTIDLRVKLENSEPQTK